VSCPRTRGTWWRWLRCTDRTKMSCTAVVTATIAGLILTSLIPTPALAAQDTRFLNNESGAESPAPAANGTALLDTGPLSESWYEVAETAAETIPADVLAAAAKTVPAATAPAPSLGGSIAGFAMGYVGYPYVAAGNGPGGFDCSGFTQFVMLNVVGIDIGHAVEGQPWNGAWVNWGAWAPGDLVFFANTYRPGISHTGIYIGDGLFVHAENEGTGVVVTSIYSAYYAARYYGAVRVG